MQANNQNFGSQWANKIILHKQVKLTEQRYKNTLHAPYQTVWRDKGLTKTFSILPDALMPKPFAKLSRQPEILMTPSHIYPLYIVRQLTYNTDISAEVCVKIKGEKPISIMT